MFEYEMTYKDYAGVEKKKTLRFNMSEPEMTLWQTSTNGGLDKLLQKLTDEKDISATMQIFDEIITRSYGEQSLDGEYFDKTEEITHKFKHSVPYEVFFSKLISDSDFAAEFVIGIMPSKYQAEIRNSDDYKKAMAELKKEK